MKTNTTVIHHSADFDGLFCREIARKFLPDAEIIGWDFGDAPLAIPNGQIYVLDLPVDKVFGFDYAKRETVPLGLNLIWIDHHKSSIESHPTDIPGYRIDGVAACRLAWQWFAGEPPNFANRAGDQRTMPSKQHFIDREVSEPRAVRLAGEYDIWDKRDPNAELFQHGLRSCPLTDGIWDELLEPRNLPRLTEQLLEQGQCLQYAKTQENAEIIALAGFTLQWEGLTFLACNHARFNSHLFTAGLKPEHDALLGFAWRKDKWVVSLYHAPGKEHHDLSLIAVRHGGGGHKGACGFTAASLLFLTV